MDPLEYPEVTDHSQKQETACTEVLSQIVLTVVSPSRRLKRAREKERYGDNAIVQSRIRPGKDLKTR